jgi:hypothetical protein
LRARHRPPCSLRRSLNAASPSDDGQGIIRRNRLLESLVDPAEGIGMNLMRLCIGTSDFAPGPT